MKNILSKKKDNKVHLVENDNIKYYIQEENNNKKKDSNLQIKLSTLPILIYCLIFEQWQTKIWKNMMTIFGCNHKTRLYP